jgi:hypothetical protein
VLGGQRPSRLRGRCGLRGAADGDGLGEHRFTLKDSCGLRGLAFYVGWLSTAFYVDAAVTAAVRFEEWLAAAPFALACGVAGEPR